MAGYKGKGMEVQSGVYNENGGRENRMNEELLHYGIEKTHRIKVYKPNESEDNKELSNDCVKKSNKLHAHQHQE